MAVLGHMDLLKNRMKKINMKKKISNSKAKTWNFFIKQKFKA